MVFFLTFFFITNHYKIGFIKKYVANKVFFKRKKQNKTSHDIYCFKLKVALSVFILNIAHDLALTFYNWFSHFATLLPTILKAFFFFSFPASCNFGAQVSN